MKSRFKYLTYKKKLSYVVFKTKNKEENLLF